MMHTVTRIGPLLSVEILMVKRLPSEMVFGSGYYGELVVVTGDLLSPLVASPVGCFVFIVLELPVGFPD